MARGLTAGMITELTAPGNRPFTLVKFEFDSADLNLWDGVGDLVFDGDTYLGAGNLLDISEIAETEDIIANSVRFTLSAIPSDIISTALTENYQGRPVSMWMGMFDASKAIVADPELIFSGSMDVMDIFEAGDASSASIIAESQLRALTRASSRVWTSADQKAILGLETDKGFDEIPLIQEKSLVWEY